ERERYDDTTKCILCAACTTACPSFWANEKFVGPAALVNAHRFIFDSRDQGGAERLAILNERNGAWRCRKIFNCTEACPREIRITQAIAEVQREILLRRSTRAAPGRPLVQALQVGRAGPCKEVCTMAASPRRRDEPPFEGGAQPVPERPQDQPGRARGPLALLAAIAAVLLLVLPILWFAGALAGLAQ